MIKTEVSLYILAYLFCLLADEGHIKALFIPGAMIFLLAIILTILRKRGVKSP